MATQTQPQTKTPSAHLMILHDISWETYEHILADHEDKGVPRFTYDRGILEIVSPQRTHERIGRALEDLAQAVADAQDIPYETLGSTTFRRAALARGFEPDGGLYLRTIPDDLPVGPLAPKEEEPPDLAIEIDVTHSSIDKLALLAAFGVPELWRYRRGTVEFHHLRAGAYERVATSAVLPGVTAEAVTRLIEEFEAGTQLTWMRRVRAWAAELAHEFSSDGGTSAW